MWDFLDLTIIVVATVALAGVGGISLFRSGRRHRSNFDQDDASAESSGAAEEGPDGSFVQRVMEVTRSALVAPTEIVLGQEQTKRLVIAWKGSNNVRAIGAHGEHFVGRVVTKRSDESGSCWALIQKPNSHHVVWCLLPT